MMKKQDIRQEDLKDRDEPGQMKLEEQFARLEETIQRLESNELSLDESFYAYQEGMKLLRNCQEAIDAVEKKVLILNEEGDWNEF